MIFRDPEDGAKSPFYLATTNGTLLTLWSVRRFSPLCRRSCWLIEKPRAARLAWTSGCLVKRGTVSREPRGDQASSWDTSPNQALTYQGG